jgi:hypothetical protein
MPPYHRADISMKYMYIKREKFNAECVISVINVYNRLNPYFMYYEVTGDLQKYRLTVATKQVWLFPVLPSLSFQFTF